MGAETVLVLRVGDDFSVSDAVGPVRDLWQELATSSEPVLFKPNLLSHRHLTGGDHAAVVTQPPVLELAWQVCDALDLPGARAVADAPQGDAVFDAILSSTGLDDWGSRRGVDIVDLRGHAWDERHLIPTRRYVLPGDPGGAVRVDLGTMSAFHGVGGRTFYGADYDIDYTNEHHRGDRHEYLFSGTALRSGVVVNIPKLKTHKKAGVTVSLKNLVGLNADKNLLPHHSLGTPVEGGDAYPGSTGRERFESGLLRRVKPWLRSSPRSSRVAARLHPLARRVLGDTQQVVRSGNWWGNDTLWRTILDLNRILRYAQPDGSLASTPQRRTVSLVDGIIAGDRNGPEAPRRVDAQIVIAGTDFVAVDIVAATFMGFDYRKVPHLRHAVEPHPLPLTEIAVDDLRVSSNVPEWDRGLWEIDPADLFRFEPHFGWTGRLERTELAASHAPG